MIEQVPIDRLQRHPDNPRRGDVSAIVESIQANGWWGVLVVQQSTGYVLVGNHRLQAAEALGMAEVPVQWVDVDDDQARRILLADNRASDLGTYDDVRLAELLRDFDGAALDGTLYTEVDLDSILGEPDPLAGIESRPQQSDDMRSLILVVPAAAYAEVIDGLVRVRDEQGLGTNAEAVVYVVDNA